MAEADTQQPSKVSFDDYSWDQDEEWQILIKKLEFPGSFDEAKKQKHILKRKQRYFKEKIDPNFEPIGTKSKKQPQPPPPQPDNEENPHDPTPTNRPTPPPVNEQKDTTKNNNKNDTSSSSTSSSTNNNQESTSSNTSSNRGYGAGGYQPYGAYQAPPTKIGMIIGPFLNYYFLLSQWFVFISCLLSLANRVFYYRALYATIIMYIINTINTNGRPQFNMYYAQRVMQDENIMIAIYAAIFLMGNPLIIFLFPIILRSLFMGTYLLNGILSVKIPSLYNKTRPYCQIILLKRGWFNEKIALCEVLMGIFLIGACFFMSRTVILTFIYWQIMHARYMMSRMIQYAFTIIHSKIQSVLSKIPFILNLYLKLSGFLWNMVDPQKIQQQMQDRAGGTGLSGLTKYCTIM